LVAFQSPRAIKNRSLAYAFFSSLFTEVGEAGCDDVLMTTALKSHRLPFSEASLRLDRERGDTSWYDKVRKSD